MNLDCEELEPNAILGRQHRLDRCVKLHSLWKDLEPNAMKRIDIEDWLIDRIQGKATGNTATRGAANPRLGDGKNTFRASLVTWSGGTPTHANISIRPSISVSIRLLERRQPSYPHDMPLKAKKGFFGEALCGMFTEGMEILGGENWIVPAFLFRLHREAAEHLFRLVMKEKVPKDIPGRTGSDFIAIALGKDGQIKRFLSGEAKCHETFNITGCKQFLKEIGEEGTGARQPSSVSADLWRIRIKVN